jgi:hypothetical protein
LGVVKCDVLHEVSVEKFEEEGQVGVIEEAYRGRIREENIGD